ncbi:unnamed protein product [Orchesella dallaii]|uniref:Peptidase A2 domain-containing protein n=1 Tax=Orchesella dallaii TaxID=48710 RepID=A0ABP1RLB1_9HEXA
MLGSIYPALLDTGSSVSLVGSIIIEKLKTLNIVPVEKKNKILGLGGISESVASVELEIQIPSGSRLHSFMLLPGIIQYVLLGRDFIGAEGIGIFVGKGGYVMETDISKMIPFSSHVNPFAPHLKLHEDTQEDSIRSDRLDDFVLQLDKERADDDIPAAVLLSWLEDVDDTFDTDEKLEDNLEPLFSYNEHLLIPAELEDIFGRELRHPFDNNLGIELSKIKETNDLQQRLTLIHDIARDNMLTSQFKSLSYKNAKSKERTLEMEQLRGSKSKALMTKEKWGVVSQRPHMSIPGYHDWRKYINNRKPVAQHPLEDLITNWQIQKEMINTVRISNTRSTKYVTDEQDLLECSLDLELNDEVMVCSKNYVNTYFPSICLIQISTPSVDYVINTVALYGKIQQHLGPILENPEKLKVFINIDDILHLQQNFEIFTVGAVDITEGYQLVTGSRKAPRDIMSEILALKIDELDDLADWRVSPLPSPLLAQLACETKNLFLCWIKLKNDLVSVESEDFPKNLFTIFCVPDQLALYLEIFKWRDGLARELDFSTNNIITDDELEFVVRAMPSSINSLFKLLKPNRELQNCHFQNIIEIIMSHRTSSFPSPENKSDNESQTTNTAPESTMRTDSHYTLSHSSSKAPELSCSKWAKRN